MGFPRFGGRIYRESLELDDPAGTGEKILVQWAPYLLGSVPFARVEFNPAKVEGEAGSPAASGPPLLAPRLGECAYHAD